MINHPPTRSGAATTPRRPPDAVRFEESRRGEILEQVRVGSLQRLRRGVYLPPAEGDGVALLRQSEALNEIRAVAERLTTNFVFSHTSAALLHGCWTWRLPPEVHVCQACTPKASVGADPRLHRHPVEIPEHEREVVVGLPVTSLERTVVDCAARLPSEQAIVVADSALRMGADEAEILRIVDTRRRTRGIRRARRVVDAAVDSSESPGESIVRWIIVDGGLPRPSTQIAVDTWNGTKWIDLGWPDVKVGVEFDGAGKYGADGRDARRDLLDEKRRHDALVEAGWTLVRVTWSELDRPDVLLTRVRRALQRGSSTT